MSIKGHWNFNELDATKVWDYSDNEYHSTSVNNLAFIASDIGYAVDLDGSTAYINYGNINDLGATDDLTIFAKIRKDTSTKGFILYKHNQYKLGVNLNDTFTFSIFVGGAWVNLTSVSTITNGTWTDIACKYDGVNIKVFKNAVEDNTAAQTGNLDASSSDFIIGYDGTTNYYDGKIETISIYNAGLTQANLTALHNSPAGLKITSSDVHPFLLGDLLCAALELTNETKGIVTYIIDTTNFYYLPLNGKFGYGDKLIRVGNNKNTARQWLFELSGKAGADFMIRDLVSSHAKRKDTTLITVRLQKSGITAKTISLTTPLSPASGGTGIANNAASTLTISGNFATTITITGITTVTLPTSGTLYGTLADSITSAQLASSVSDETGTGVLVFGTSPTFTTQITSPLVIGGAAVNSSLELRSTSGVGTTSFIKFTVGNNGATEAMRITNSGFVGIGTSLPTKSFELAKDFVAGDGIIMTDSSGGYFSVNQATGVAGAFQAAFTGYGTGEVSSLVFKGLRTTGTKTYACVNFIVRDNTDSTFIATTDIAFNFQNHTTQIMRILGDGRIGIGIISPTAIFHLKAGTATANTAPLQFTSGISETVARAGVVEFTTDDLFFTITTGAARKGFIFNDGTNLTSGRVPIITTNGRLTDDADFTFEADTLTVTKIAATTITGNLTFADGVNVAINDTTGTKIGLTPISKIGFWDAAPVVQPTGIINADGTIGDITTKFNSLLSKLETVGLLAVA